MAAAEMAAAVVVSVGRPWRVLSGAGARSRSQEVWKVRCLEVVSSDSSVLSSVLLGAKILSCKSNEQFCRNRGAGSCVCTVGLIQCCSLLHRHTSQQERKYRGFNIFKLRT